MGGSASVPQNMGAGVQGHEDAHGATVYDFVVRPTADTLTLLGYKPARAEGKGGSVRDKTSTEMILRIAPEAIIILDPNDGAMPRPVQHHPYHTILCWGHTSTAFQFRILDSSRPATSPMDKQDRSPSFDDQHDSDSKESGGDGGTDLEPDRRDGDADHEDGRRGADDGHAHHTNANPNGNGDSPGAGSAGGDNGSTGARDAERRGSAMRPRVQRMLQFVTPEATSIEKRTLATVKLMMEQMDARAVTDVEFDDLREELARHVGLSQSAEDEQAEVQTGAGAFSAFGSLLTQSRYESTTEIITSFAPTKVFIARQGVELLRWFHKHTSSFDAVEAAVALHGRLMQASSFQLLLNEFSSRTDRDNVCHRLGLDPNAQDLSLECPDGIMREPNHAAIRRGGAPFRGVRRSEEQIRAAEQKLSAATTGTRHEVQITPGAGGVGLSLEVRFVCGRHAQDIKAEVVCVESTIDGLPAAAALEKGEIAIGDILCSINGTSVVGLRMNDVTTHFKACRSGDRVKLEFLRPDIPARQGRTA